MKNLVCLLICWSLVWNAAAQGGQLDPGFGNNGKVLFDMEFTHTLGRDIVIQPDGKLVTLGGLEKAEDHIILTRFLPDGSLDLSFGTDGKVLFYHITGGYKDDIYGLSLALQANGRIVVAGYIRSYPKTDVLLLRFNANGALDTSFGNAGEVISNLGNNLETAYSVAIQDNGGILIAGRTGYPNGQIFIQRYLSTGVLDNTFAGTGTLLMDIDPVETDGLLDIMLQQDGKILAAGYAKDAAMVLLRLLPSGVGDTSFGIDGVVIHDIPGYLSQANALALLPDGKIALAGSIIDTTSTAYADFCVARLLPNGQFDTSFNMQGWVKFDVEPAVLTAASGIIIDSEENMVISGFSDGRFCLSRLTPAGVLDDAFGLNGTQITVFHESTPDYLYGGAFALVQQPDGKLVVNGTTNRTQTILRYLENGVPDQAFGAEGLVQTTFYSPNSMDQAYAAALLQDGKIVIAGDTQNDNFDSNSEFGIAQFLPDGSLDLSFGINGRQATALGRSHDAARAIAVQPDGMILLAGYASVGVYQYPMFALTRFLPNGQIDENFGENGLVYTNFSTGEPNNRANAMVLQADGKIVLAGHTESGFNNNGFAVARYMPDGLLDSSFGNGGKVVVSLSNKTQEAFAIALQTDGKLLLAGGGSDVMILRLNPDGSLDSTFGNGGKIIKDFGYTNEMANAIVQQPDGKIVVAGNINNTIEGFLARYLPDGSPDPSFDGNGLLVTEFGYDSKAYSLGLQNDGKILVGGSGDYDFVLARYLSNGFPDPDFGNYGLAKAGFSGGSGNNVGRAILLEPDHDIVLAGYSFSWTSNYDLALVRFKAGAVNNVAQPESNIKRLHLYGTLAIDAALLSFQLEKAGNLSLEIYQMNGKLVASPLIDVFFPAGEHEVRFQTAGLLPGHYVVVLKGQHGQASTRLVKVW
jgi:uncharacterized delta-60 repeat protein